MSKANSLTDYVFLCMRDNNWWTFWELQNLIKFKTGNFYGEPSISAAIRDLRKEPYRHKYGLPLSGEVVEKKRINNGRGYKYKLKGVENG
tara:strand:+ start:4518 stop:4787 length:270 start_codon:yes stop_codon:yes gene_type:complete